MESLLSLLNSRSAKLVFENGLSSWTRWTQLRTPNRVSEGCRHSQPDLPKDPAMRSIALKNSFILAADSVADSLRHGGGGRRR